MSEVGTTALVAVLPAARALLDAAARVDPALVRPGLPAHATIRYPFLPATRDLVAALREVVARQPAVAVELTSLVEGPGFVGLAVPELEPLRDAVLQRWPEPPPYRGRFGPAPPVHLTVALDATQADAARVRTAVRGLLPVRERVTGLQLVELTPAGWRPHATLPLGCHRPG